MMTTKWQLGETLWWVLVFSAIELLLLKVVSQWFEFEVPEKKPKIEEEMEYIFEESK